MAETLIQVGNKAPLFTLPDQDGNQVSLKDLSGQWVVLYFYPKDDTPGCTKEACQFTNELNGFAKLGAAVLGVSPDDASSHHKFIDKYKLKITLLSDPQHRVMAKYNAWGLKINYGRKSEGVIRSTTLIGPGGKIAFHWAKVKADGHADKVKKKLRELKCA